MRATVRHFTDGGGIIHTQTRPRESLMVTLTVMIRVGNKSIWFNAQATHWMGMWIEAHLMFKEHHNRCMNQARAAEARLRTLTRS
jgi:hypothetical protein